MNRTHFKEDRSSKYSSINQKNTLKVSKIRIVTSYVRLLLGSISMAACRDTGATCCRGQLQPESRAQPDLRPAADQEKQITRKNVTPCRSLLPSSVRTMAGRTNCLTVVRATARPWRRRPVAMSTEQPGKRKERTQPARPGNNSILYHQVAFLRFFKNVFHNRLSLIRCG